MKKLFIETTSFSLHILAMLFMFIDHAGVILFPKVAILRCIGRLAFPIFAFLAVEGFFYTKNLKKYISRFFIWAIISEIPYNLLKTGTIKDFAHRNVLWTFLFGIILIYIIDTIRKRYGDGIILLISLFLVIPVSYAYSILVCADYRYAGIFTMFVFYLFRGNGHLNRICQFIALFVINTFLLSRSRVILGSIILPWQPLALFALIPIWLYKGKQGYRNKFVKFFNYAFYPLHIIVLIALKLIVK